jgi:hypothetical protein
MSTAKQTPLGVNALSALLQNTGLNINPGVTTYVGTSCTNEAYSPGTLITSTVLNKLVKSINLAYPKLYSTIDPNTYAKLISIGSTTIPALGDSKPTTYTFNGVINNGDPNRSGDVKWDAYDYYGNPVTQWGFMRLYALQANNEFNWNVSTNSIIPYYLVVGRQYQITSIGNTNFQLLGASSNTVGVVFTATAAGTSGDTGTVLATLPDEYKDFLSSFTTCDSFINSTNKTINTLNNAPTFLKGTYSNMDDLMTSDVAGVSLASQAFGQDLLATGKVIDLSKLEVFGLPSVLLKTIKRYNANTQSLSLALLSSGLTVSEIDGIFSGATPTKLQEQQIYSAFLLIVGYDLANILVPLNCKTQGLTNLADLLNPIMLFPNSYQTLTVPVYNASPGPTNSKTYYPIYSGSGVNSSMKSASVGRTIGAGLTTGIGSGAV